MPTGTFSRLLPTDKVNCVPPDSGPHLCECGCGKYTNLIKKTDPVEGYIRGHYFHFLTRHARRGFNWFKASSIEKVCPVCNATKPITQFRKTSRPDRPDRYGSRCLECDKQYKEKWYRENEQEVRMKQAAKHLRITYGITLDAYRTMVAKCGNVCEICKRPSGSRRLSVDHCHKTGTLRGLLCNKCNGLLGMADDDPLVLESAIKYLQQRG